MVRIKTMSFQNLYNKQAPELIAVLDQFYAGNDEALVDLIGEVRKTCRFLAYDPNNGPKPHDMNQCLLALAHYAIDHVYEAYAKSRQSGNYPEIRVSYNDDLKPVFDRLNIAPGSPQDILYTLTSERAAGWAESLSKLGFLSACMSEVGTATLITQPRLLDTSAPDKILDELPGSITIDFYRNLEAIQQSSVQLRDFLIFASKNINYPEKFIKLEIWDINHIEDLKNWCQHEGGLINLLAKTVFPQYYAKNQISLTKWNKDLKANSRQKGSQEQLVLKYIHEAKLLQKFLGGTIVDHVASNVKMQANPLRKNKVEVDSIYGIVGGERPGIVLVEAKDKPTISTTQLYSLYEAFRLRIPPSWDLHLIAALMADSPDEMAIDLIHVYFPDEALGNISRSLANLNIRRHYRWRIAKR
jgi:hypothetical protein